MADDSGKDVIVKFGADIADLKGKFDEVGGLFKSLTEKFAVLAAVVGGGAAFKSFIDEANKLTGETVKLAKTLGVAGDEADALNTALAEIGSDSDTYTGAFLKFNRALRTNSEGLKELGVDVEGFKSGQKSSNEVFMESLKIVSRYAPGIDQTQVAMKLFGRSVGDVQTLLKLNNDELEKARKKNEELNLTVSQEGVDASKAYKRAMADVNLVLQGLEKTVGEAMIPIFTKSAQALASIGPALVEGMKVAVEVFVDIYETVRDTVSDVLGAAMEIVHSFGDLWTFIFGTEGPGAMTIFKNVLAIVQVAFIAFRVLVQEVINAVRTTLQDLGNAMVTVGVVIGASLGSLGDVFKAFAKLVSAALSFDVAGASAAWDELKAATSAGVGKVGAALKDGMSNRERIIAEGNAKAAAIAAKGSADIEAALMKPLTGGPAKPKTEYKPPGGDDKADIGKKGKDQAAAEAAAMKQLLKAQDEAQLALTKEFLKETQQALDDSYKDGLTSTKNYYDQKLAITLASTDAEIQAKRKELADTKRLEESVAKPEQKLKFRAQEAQLEGQINVLLASRSAAIRENGEASAEAITKLHDALVQFQSDQAKAQGNDRVAAEKAQLEQLKSLRKISADDAVAMDVKLENDSYAITRKALDDKAQLIKGNELEQQKAREALQLEQEGAEQQHQQKLTQISNQAELERERYSLQTQSALQGSFGNMIGTMLSGTEKLSDTFRNFAINVSNLFTNLIGQRFSERIFDATGVNKAIDSAVGFVTDGIAKIVAKMIGGEAAQTAATQGGAAARTALNAAEAAMSVESTGEDVAATVLAESTMAEAATAADIEKAASAETSAAAGILAQQTETVAAIFGYAAEAAVAAMASAAAIPFVGWAMAPEVGAGIYATGLAYLASAAGGWGEVPDDQIAQVHKKEMILPAHLAEGIRDMIDGTSQKSNLPTAMPSSVAQASQASTRATPSDQQISQAQSSLGARSGDAHFHVSAIDAAGVKQFFDTHGRSIAKSLANQSRNFVGVKAT